MGEKVSWLGRSGRSSYPYNTWTSDDYFYPMSGSVLCSRDLSSHSSLRVLAPTGATRGSYLENSRIELYREGVSTHRYFEYGVSSRLRIRGGFLGARWQSEIKSRDLVEGWFWWDDLREMHIARLP